jgi:hypothetical protein
MKKETKQTVVDWLVNEFKAIELHYESILGKMPVTISDDLLFKKAIIRAKQIDKENIIQAFEEGNKFNGWALKHEPEQYYNETFKKEEK